METNLITTSHPEVLLPSIFVDLCNLAARLPGLGIKQEIQKNFDDVLRKVYISQELYKTSTIAIAGLQGAGKTFFVKNYLGLDDEWLPDNMGRGERYPILIKENDSLTQPRGIIRKLAGDGEMEIESEDVSPTEFIDIVRGKLKEKILLPMLQVPPTPALLGELSIILLPGFEAEDSEDWQKLMHHTMLSASLPVIVTTQE